MFPVISRLWMIVMVAEVLAGGSASRDLRTQPFVINRRIMDCNVEISALWMKFGVETSLLPLATALMLFRKVSRGTFLGFFFFFLVTSVTYPSAAAITVPGTSHIGQETTDWKEGTGRQNNKQTSYLARDYSHRRRRHRHRHCHCRRGEKSCG